MLEKYNLWGMPLSLLLILAVFGLGLLWIVFRGGRTR